MRKLASIQSIKEILPIEGADRVELAKVLGWQCVVEKGKYTLGEKVIYCEVDSFLPVKEEFEFLRSSSFRKNTLLGEGFRVRTITLRGQLSQGLVLPLDLLPEGTDVSEGNDVTAVLGIKEWEVPEVAGNFGTIVGGLPEGFIPSDETRIQSLPDILKEFANVPYYITTKMDGTSCMCGVTKNKDGERKFHVTGHYTELKDDGKSAFYEYVKKKDIPSRLENLVNSMGYGSLVIKGEWCGEGVQKNRLKLKTPEWYVFTVDIDGKRADLSQMADICRKLDLKMVPIEEEGTNLAAMYKDTDALILRSKGSYPNGGPKEGIVIRPRHTIYSESLKGPLSFKVLNPKYLLKHEEE